jgi:hypothetical protein
MVGVDDGIADLVVDQLRFTGKVEVLKTLLDRCFGNGVLLDRRARQRLVQVCK